LYALLRQVRTELSVAGIIKGADYSLWRTHAPPERLGGQDDLGDLRGIAVDAKGAA